MTRRRHHLALLATPLAASLALAPALTSTATAAPTAECRLVKSEDTQGGKATFTLEGREFTAVKKVTITTTPGGEPVSSSDVSPEGTFTAQNLPDDTYFATPTDSPNAQPVQCSKSGKKGKGDKDREKDKDKSGRTPAVSALTTAVTTSPEKLDCTKKQRLDIALTGTISAQGSGKVTYRWVQDENTARDPATITFKKAGSQPVKPENWTVMVSTPVIGTAHIEILSGPSKGKKSTAAKIDVPCQ
ncbi:hypothetical protein [Streptomyces sp. NPDC000410]|uniref:hypothetical protein n=1 Tax=Streptomyces sp. NPDC000410 TaxID=3154254 RepID=UPI003329518A